MGFFIKDSAHSLPIGSVRSLQRKRFFPCRAKAGLMNNTGDAEGEMIKARREEGQTPAEPDQ